MPAHRIAALQAGKHVLCEKAMAKNAAECDQMIAAAEAAQRTLAVAYYRRCYPACCTWLLHDGAIGTPQRIWINDQFPTSHRIDLCHFFAGDVVRMRVDEQPLPPDSNADFGPVLTAEHASGVTSIMNVDWRENHDIEQVIIDGDNGRIVVADLKAGRVKVVRGWSCEDHDQPPLPFTHWGLMDNFMRAPGAGQPWHAMALRAANQR